MFSMSIIEYINILKNTSSDLKNIDIALLESSSGAAVCNFPPTHQKLHF